MGALQSCIRARNESSSETPPPQWASDGLRCVSPSCSLSRVAQCSLTLNWLVRAPCRSVQPGWGVGVNRSTAEDEQASSSPYSSSRLEPGPPGSEPWGRQRCEVFSPPQHALRGTGSPSVTVQAVTASLPAACVVTRSTQGQDALGWNGWSILALSNHHRIPAPTLPLPLSLTAHSRLPRPTHTADADTLVWGLVGWLGSVGRRHTTSPTKLRSSPAVQADLSSEHRAASLYERSDGRDQRSPSSSPLPPLPNVSHRPIRGAPPLVWEAPSAQ